MAGYSTLQEFISHVKAIGLPLGSHFFVVMPEGFGEGKTASRTIAMLCDSVNIPGMNLMTSEQRISGEATEMPYNIAYPTASLNFMLDNNFSVKKYFETWTNLVFDRNTRTLGYYRDYTKTVSVYVTDRAGNCIYQVDLMECYPKGINDIPLNYSNHTVMSLDVTLFFKYWVQVSVDKNGNPNSTRDLEQRLTLKKIVPGLQAGTVTQDNFGQVFQETLANTTGIGQSGPGQDTPVDFQFGQNIETELAEWGPDTGADFIRLGNSSSALLISSGINPAEEPNFGTIFGDQNKTLGGQMGSLGTAIGELGKSMSSVAAPAAAIGTAVSGVAGTITSMDTLLRKVGINTGLGQVGKDMAQTAGRIAVVSQILGIPGSLGAVGANMGAISGDMQVVAREVANLPNATAQVSRAISNVGRAFGLHGNELSNASSGIQSGIDNGTL